MHTIKVLYQYWVLIILKGTIKLDFFLITILGIKQSGNFSSVLYKLS